MKVVLKKIALLFMAAVMVASSVPAVSAVSASGKIYPFIPQVNKYYKAAEVHIAKCLRNLETDIDISDYDVAEDDILYVFKAAVFDNPDIFYVNAAYIDYRYNRAENKVYYIQPQYIFKYSKIPDYISKFNKETAKLLDGIKTSWSAYRKALVLHDRLAVHCEYKESNDKSYTAYNAIVTRKAVCEGYARAYSYLLSKVGVQSKIINCEQTAHCWNMVKYGGKWYHVDVTGDDPMPDTAGYVSHKLFMCSDTQLKSYKTANHKGWKNDVTYSSAYKCSSDRFKKAFYRSVTTQIAVDGSSYYYLKQMNGYTAIMKNKDSTKKVKYKLYDNWTQIGYLSGAKLAYLDGCIYFNGKRSIYRYKISTGKVSRLYTLKSSVKTDFYGIKIYNRNIYAVKKSYSTQKKSPVKLLKIT